MTPERCVCHLEGTVCREDIQACTPGRPTVPDGELSQEPKLIRKRERYRRRKELAAEKLASRLYLETEEEAMKRCGSWLRDKIL